MNTRHHLTPEDWADALAGGDRAEGHLAACPACRGELAELQALMSDTREAGAMPEPSPLFWEAFSARVREAVDAQPVPSRWWTAYWRPVAAMASVLATVVLVLASQSSPRPQVVRAPESVVASDGDAIIVWSLIEQVVALMPIDAVAEAGILPAAEATAAAIDDLSPAEIEHLRRLLREELSGVAQ